APGRAGGPGGGAGGGGPGGARGPPPPGGRRRGGGGRPPAPGPSATADPTGGEGAAGDGAVAPPRLRLDTGYTGGDTIGVHYDPLLAKVIAWAPTREAALRRLRTALRRARVHGPVTNRDLLVRTLGHPDVVAGRLDTGFYDRHLAALTAPDPGPGARHAAVAAALADAASRALRDGVPARLGGWRNVPSAPQTKTYGAYEVRYRATRDGFVVEPADDADRVGSPDRVDDADRVDAPGGGAGAPEPSGDLRVVAVSPARVSLDVGGVVRHFDIAVYGGEVHVDSATGAYRLLARPRFAGPGRPAEAGSLLAPMPGTVVRVAEGLTEGAWVGAGQPVVWLEAMKMEHRVVAPASGTLTALHAVPGRQVEVGALLAVVTATDAPEEDPS
ncbi:biotin/lipoyl-containing protein, partial [Streptomyces sp. NPDC059096]|uniref:biotin/lipoyl-containing protein n=1 Tax=Streptomyces sp. NPDC059096 TaxID=3346727 RepID=UPI003676BA26